MWMRYWVKFTSGAGGKKATTGRDTQTGKPVLKRNHRLEFAAFLYIMKKLEEAKPNIKPHKERPR
jgi:hypothetical protein